MAHFFSSLLKLLNKIPEFWIYIFFSIFICGYLWYIISYPIDYWDMLPYMGAVEELDGSSISEIHTKTYYSFISFANDLQEKKLLHSHPFCERNFHDPDYFKSQLPFFSIKWLYVRFSWLFYSLGASLFYAVQIPVWLSFIAFSAFILLMLKRTLPTASAALFACIILVLPFNRYVFSISSPDALSGTFIAFAILFYFTTETKFFIHLFLILAVLTRPDCIFLYGTWIIMYRHKCNRLFTLKELLDYSGLFFAIVSIFLIQFQSGYEGNKMFYRSFIELYPSNFPNLNITLYFRGIFNGVKQSLLNKTTWLLFFSIPFFLIFRKIIPEKNKQIFWVFIISLGIKFFFHPLIISRFTFVLLDLIIITIILLLYEWINPKKVLI